MGGGRGIRMNQGASPWGEFHFVTAHSCLLVHPQDARARSASPESGSPSVRSPDHTRSTEPAGCTTSRFFTGRLHETLTKGRFPQILGHSNWAKDKKYFSKSRWARYLAGLARYLAFP